MCVGVCVDVMCVLVWGGGGCIGVCLRVCVCVCVGVYVCVHTFLISL